MGLKINHMTGIEGQVELAGYKAVVGTFIRWTLERLGENDSGVPSWTLRASLSYHKDSMLLNAGLKKRVRLKAGSSEWYAEMTPASRIRVVDEQLTIEGVTLWPVEKRP